MRGDKRRNMWLRENTDFFRVEISKQRKRQEIGKCVQNKGLKSKPNSIFENME